MKKLTLLFLVYTFSSTCFSQDIINHYNPENLFELYNTQGSPTYYDGEYQIRISSFYWSFWWLNDYTNFISYDFECVSYPFVPDCYINMDCTPSSNVRNFEVLPDNLLNTIVEPYPGFGWIISSGMDVYQYSNPLGFDYPNETSYPTTLVTRSYISDAPWETDRMILPHTILRITLNVHEGTTIDGEIKVKISWLYDNTRGRMRYYPFTNENDGMSVNSTEKYDVIFMPKILYDGIPDWGELSNHQYNTTSNLGWFNGAYPSGINPIGSINYIHEDDVEITGPFNPGFGNNYFPDDFGDFYFYPAPYALLSPPLRNKPAKAYAGFDDYGEYEGVPNSNSTFETGIEHTYTINSSIDLENINPSEKIIYNPSKVSIDCDLTFPEDYKFLTVHGKYPDKAWVMTNNTGFDDLRDVLCPTDQIGDFLSEYELGGSSVELTIEPGVTIMDAKFTGSGKIFFHPDNLRGNFEISSPGINLICIPETLIIVDQELTWNHDFLFEGDLMAIQPGATLIINNHLDFEASLITIESGGTLIVKNTLEVDNDTKIIVKRGAKLTIDGGTITGPHMWQGIEVWGTATANQNPTDQGWLKVINGGTIEKASTAIKTIKEDNNGSEGTLDFDYTGGIVQASEANFINNKVAVHFYDYGLNSVSGFGDCYFTTDNNFSSTNNPDYFIRMNSVKGISFIGCHFSNASSNPCYGGGIYSFNSGFAVKGKCLNPGEDCTEWEAGTFTNLKRGIYATSGGSLYFPLIDHINFSGQNRSIYFSAIEYGLITNCTISTGPVSGYDWPYGIYLDRSSGYKIEDNYINKGEIVGLGIVVNNSGGEPNQIYRNQFEDLVFGILAQQSNRSYDGTTGLVLKCNEYTGNEYDQAVSWDAGGLMLNTAGIAAFQGANENAPDAPAGNRFSWTGPLGEATDIYNEANDVYYYYHYLQNDPWHLRPDYYTDETVFPFPNTNPGAYWEPEESCPSSDPGGGNSDDESEMKGRMASTDAKADSVQNIINLLKDGGSTEDLKWEVDISTTQQAYDVYNELMNNSPYISDTVMESAIEKEEVLPNVMIRDVMVANPHNAKDDVLLGKIEERNNPMPDYMKAQILQGQSLVSVYENLRSNLAHYKQKRGLVFNKLISYYLADTLNPAVSMDSLSVLLENDNGLMSKYRLALLSLGQGAGSTGLDVLNSIPSQFILRPEEQEAHQQLINYYNLLAGIAQEGKALTDADSLQIENLFEIEAHEKGKAPVYARNVLLAMEETSWDEPIILPDFSKSAALEQKYEDLLSALDDHHYLEIFPNPARDYLILEHQLEMDYEAVIVKIANAQGVTQMQVNLVGRQNQKTLNISQLKAGVYVATILVNNKEIESVKFTKVK
ncbi:MAG: T9SS type A sorting domain-containing protein [Bacteroidales bacterium]|nr:T9SS type A sorting domain-containing protein [Bacteroidales bacterium]MCF8403541.1 T9SS type A sorting domain-containing protein [Bacteroidales bacterium]